ncbi:hypothetical protein SAMN05443668_1381, partial [Cryptosporangium aurantiacum]
GWQGAFALDAEAHGEGPPTFAAMLTQEFQWSRSLTVVLLGMTAHLRRMPWSLRIRFLHALLYYPILTFTIAGGLCLAPIAVVTGLQWVNVPYLEFLVRWGAVNCWALGMGLVLRWAGVRRPNTAPLLSWEEWLYMLTRWPLILRGVVAAVVQRIRPTPIDFRVTPKGADGFQSLPTAVIYPYLFLSLTMSTFALAGEYVTRTPSWGYLLLCLLAAATYTIVSLSVPLLHAREAATATGTNLRYALERTARVPFVLAVLLTIPLGVAIASYPYVHLRMLLL